jgi:hypothetical protein
MGVSNSQSVDNLVMTGHNQRKLSTPLTKALRSGALRREAKRGISKRRTRAIGRGLCLGIVIATITQLNAYASTNTDHYKLYLHSKLISEKQYKCAYYVAHIESRWNPLAHNAGHYGLFQMKNDKVKYLNAYQQIDMWLRYVAHRYDNKPCKAMSHLKIRNWQ